jgi:hypothetical protein
MLAEAFSDALNTPNLSVQAASSLRALESMPSDPKRGLAWARAPGP